MSPVLLLVDDDPVFDEVLSAQLRLLGYEVLVAESGCEGLRLAYQSHPDLVILDLGMPDMDGFETCRRLRQMSDVPVLVLTASPEKEDLLRAFELGADDFLRKPCDLQELQARLQANLKRAGSQWEKPVYSDGWLTVDLNQRRILRQGHPVHLSPTEFRLLEVLVEHMGSVMRREELLQAVWGRGYEDALSNLSLYVRYLREKLEPNPAEPNYILTEWGMGYWFFPRQEKALA
jgi:two-component system KDP operon response regulator KdpE